MLRLEVRNRAGSSTMQREGSARCIYEWQPGLSKARVEAQSDLMVARHQQI